MPVAKTEATAISIDSSHNPFQAIRKDPLDGVYNGLLDALDSVEKQLHRSKKIAVALEIVVLLGLLACFAATCHVESIRNRRFLDAWLWEWTVLLIVVVSGLSIVRFVTYVACLPISRWGRWRIDRNLLFFVLRAKTNFDVMLWLALILATWYATVKPRLAEMGAHRRDHGVLAADHLITGLLIATAMGSFLWLLKSLLYLKLEADLHYNQLFDRIHRTITDFHVIHVIYGKKGWRFLFIKDHPPQDEDSAKFWLNVFRMERETAPLWIVRRLAKAYERHMESVRMPGNPGDSRNEQKLVDQAWHMLDSVVGQHKAEHSDVLEKDLRDVSRDEFEEYLRNVGFQEGELIYVLKKINMEDDEESSKKQQNITVHDFLSWAVTAYRSCWSLQRTLDSSKGVFIKLNRLMNGFVITIVLVIWLLLSQVVTTGQLALLFSPFLAASFIFGESCKKMFEGLIFAFSIRPFDVGDRVVIDGMQMKVTELHILTSVFFKYDTQEEIVYPNSVLMEKNIANLDIIPDQADYIEFNIPRDTPVEDIKELELKIIKYLEDDDSDYGPSKVVKKALVGNEEINMTVYFKYMVSYLAAECRALRKSKILTKIIKFCKEMEEGNSNRPYSPTEKPDIVKFTVERRLKLEQIYKLKADVMRCLEDAKIYDKKKSKVVIKKITKEDITMALYLLPLASKEIKYEEEEKKKIENKIENVNGVKGVVKGDHDHPNNNQGKGENREIDQVKNKPDTGSANVIAQA